jgi:hypothetical protein
MHPDPLVRVDGFTTLHDSGMLLTFRCGGRREARPEGAEEGLRKRQEEDQLKLEGVKIKYALGLFDSRFAREKRIPEWVDRTEKNLEGLTTVLRINRVAAQQRQEAHHEEKGGEVGP